MGIMVQRVTLRGKTRYVTASKLSRKVRTPGNKIVLIKENKTRCAPKCSDCKMSLQGVKRPVKAGSKKLKGREKRVSRIFGGNTCAKCLKDKILKSFLSDEARIGKRLSEGNTSK